MCLVVGNAGIVLILYFFFKLKMGMENISEKTTRPIAKSDTTIGSSTQGGNFAGG